MIVFDSSTIILLAKTELLDVLLNDYDGEITVPKAVEQECTRKATFDGLLIRKRIAEKKITVKNIRDSETLTLMRDFNLHIGEAEAVMLALRHKESILAIDDKNAIYACKMLKIPFTTALNILVRAKEKNLLQKEEALLKLKELESYGRYKKELIRNAKKKLEGGK